MRQKEDIAKINQMIAEFMGYSICAPTGWYGYWQAWLPTNKTHHPLDNLKFHSSWDWLMPVVEKISEMFGKAPLYMEVFSKWLNESGSEDFLIFRMSLEDTYEAVVEFIKWYNENKH